MIDYFERQAASLEAPLSRLVAVTPDDAADLPAVSRGVYVGTGGDLRVTTVGGDTVTLANVQAGWHPIRVARVLATGTTAGGIVAGW